MNIFESLENLNVSEECFDEIMSIVEDLLGEGTNLVGVVDRAYEKGRLRKRQAHKDDLAIKALEVESPNDFNTYTDPNGRLRLHLSRTRHSKDKNWHGDQYTDMRRNHPNPDELKSQRETDKEHGYPLASVKSIVRHRNKNKRP